MENKKEIVKENVGFAIPKQNYKFIAIGLAIILIGFLLMLGGKSDDPKVFNPDVFSFTRITLAPIVVMIGLLFEVWAIMRKPKE